MYHDDIVSLVDSFSDSKSDFTITWFLSYYRISGSGLSLWNTKECKGDSEHTCIL